MKEIIQEKILLVDDTKNIINNILNLLVANNYLVKFVNNSFEAIHLLKKDDFDLVLLDLFMPNINGFEILKTIRKKFSNIELPIIMLTDESSVDDITKFLEFGSNDYISKDTDFSIINARIKAQLNLKKIEKENSINKKIFQDFFDNSSDLIQSVNLKGKFEYVNNTWLKTLGYEKEDIPNLNLIEIIAPDSKGHCLKILEQLKEGNVENEFIETSFITKTGQIIKVEGHFSISFEKGKPIATRCIFKDVTEKKNTLKEIKEKNQILNAILLNIPIIVFRIDKNFNFTECLGSGLKKFGLIVNDELKGMNVELLYSNDYSDFFVSAMEGHFSSFISTKKVSEKEIIYFQNYIFFDKENKEGVIGIAIDITDRKIIENDLEKTKNKALIANNAKSDFLRLMSHEIRTPMNGVIGMTELLMETELNEEQNDLLKSLKTSGNHLLTIINDILDFSKIESGKINIINNRFDLNSCIEGVIEIFSSKVFEKNINLVYYIDSSIDTSIITDYTRLEQILANLVSNALKFTNDNGEIFIFVDKVKEVFDLKKDIDFNSTELIFSISDTGIGINKDSAKNLFNPFTRMNNYYGGTGLGLAICEKLVNFLNGKIWVESKENNGSTFNFTIKVTQTEPIIEEESNIKSSLLKNKKILLVNKNLMTLTILQKKFSEWGIITPCITDYNEIPNYLDANINFDAIVIDIDLPEFDISFFENLNEKYKLPPILAISFLAKNLAKEKSTKNLNIIYQTKPIKYSGLFNKLLSLLVDKDKQLKEKKDTKILDKNLKKILPLKILVAEDNPLNQKLILHILEKMGYKADLANDGLEVIHFLGKDVYDIIFMDMQMPKMNGFETTEKIIEIYKNNRPKIIAITANAIEGDREKCLEVGMDDYMSKPVSIEKIQNKIKYWGEKLLK